LVFYKDAAPTALGFPSLPPRARPFPPMLRCAFTSVPVPFLNLHEEFVSVFFAPKIYE
jgi:hypothetical protein